MLVCSDVASRGLDTSRVSKTRDGLVQVFTALSPNSTVVCYK